MNTRVGRVRALVFILGLALTVAGCTGPVPDGMPPVFVNVSRGTATAPIEPTGVKTETPVVVPTKTPMAPPIGRSTVLVQDREAMVRLACDLLNDDGGYCFGEDTAVLAPVRFPSGTPGALVAVGHEMLLFRAEEGGVQLVDRQGPSVGEWGVWGLTDFVDGRAELIPAAVEWLDLFPGGVGQSQPALKVTGWSHPGPGILYNGVFEILVVAEDGLHLLFRDYERHLFAPWTPPGEERRSGRQENFAFRYEDVDQDGIKEIVKQGSVCEIRQDETTGDWLEVPGHCEPVSEQYSFDGTQYVRTCCVLYERHLPGGYVVQAERRLETAMILEQQADGTWFPVVWPAVLAYGWNEDFIIAKSQPAIDFSYWNFAPDRFLWHLIDLRSGTATMVFSEDELAALRAQVGVPADLRLTEFVQPAITPPDAGEVRESHDQQ